MFNNSIISNGIPKNIFITYKTKDIDKLPYDWKKNYESLKTHMKEWEIYFFDDNDNNKFMLEHFPDYYHTIYTKFPYNIQRIDSIRYAWLYVMGGLYVDMDIGFNRNIDSLITKPGIYLTKSGNISSYLTNSIMISEARNPFWLAMLEYTKIKLPFFYGKHWTVMCTTGPIAITNAVKKEKLNYHLLSPELWLPCSVCNIKCDSKNAITNQSQGCTWASRDTKFYNILICHTPLAIFLLILMILFLLLIAYYI